MPRYAPNKMPGEVPAGQPAAAQGRADSIAHAQRTKSPSASCACRSSFWP